MGGLPKRARSTALCTLACMLAVPSPHADAQQSQQVEVIGTSPLPGLGVDREVLPYSSVVVRRGQIDQAQSDNVGDFISRRLPGAQTSDVQGNPWQTELSFRGYRASGLIGAAQGLSVYLDGVRINEPFGDVVNWDLVPEFALQSLSLVPGANPAFGLNTLGGAIALATTDGKSSPGLRVEGGLGSFGRTRLEASDGSSDSTGWQRYIGASWFNETGWREHSPSRIGQMLLKIGSAGSRDSWSATLLAARSKLIGNALLPDYSLAPDGTRTPDLYAYQRNAIYTYPDPAVNTLGHLSVHWTRDLDAAARLQATAYLRASLRDASSGDVSDQVGVQASINATATRQTAAGAAISLARKMDEHQWQIGAALDATRVRFEQTEQDASFDLTRGTVADPASVPALNAAVRGHALSLGVYATDTWRLAPATHLTATARANQARVSNQLTSLDDVTGLLNVMPQEDFSYASLNPALGITQALGAGPTVFASVARNTRVPTAIELGCADPAQPCRLPAGLQSDPYLKQVRSTSIEAGMRWRPAEGQRIEATLHRTDNRDDIIFGSISTTGQLGYFQNFPRTRNQGLDVMWQGRLGDASLSASYSALRATYQAAGVLRIGERNVTVQPGTRMAGLPDSSFKLALDFKPAPGWTSGIDFNWVSGSVVQGNEDGLIADGSTTPVDLRMPAYALLHWRLSWRAGDSVEVVARINNLTDRRYANYGALGTTVFDAQGVYTGTPVSAVFVAPGTPRSVFVGLRASF